jgi:predicted Zn-dependent protease
MPNLHPKTRKRPGQKVPSPKLRDETLKLATRAMKAREWQKAVDHWAELRKSGARVVAAYDQAARALIHLDRSEEAEVLIQEGIQRFPKNATLALRHAALPEHRKDWSQAVTRWQAFHQRFKGTAHSHLQHGKALILNGQTEEAEALLGIAAQRWPDDRLIATERAALAVHRRDWPLALERWRGVRTRFEDSATASQGECEALIALGLLDEAETLIQATVSRHPDHPGLMMQGATVAMQRQDWVMACERWSTFRQRFGISPEICEQEVEALIQSGQTEAAKTLLMEATRRYPNRQPLALKLAQRLSQQQDWILAAERWKLLRKRFSPTVESFLEEARALTQLERWDEAESVLNQARRRWPRDRKLARQWAELALLRQDWQTAADRWQRFRKANPNHPVGYLKGIQALMARAEFEQAASLLEHALTRFPQKPELIAWQAEIGLAREEAATVNEWEGFYRAVLEGRSKPATTIEAPAADNSEPPPTLKPPLSFWRKWTLGKGA